MIALWRWPCALLALLLSGFGGLRSLPADERAADEAERVVVSRSAPTAAAVVDLPRLARWGHHQDWSAAFLSAALPADRLSSPAWAAGAEAWRPAPSLRRGSAGGARAP